MMAECGRLRHKSAPDSGRSYTFSVDSKDIKINNSNLSNIKRRSRPAPSTTESGPGYGFFRKIRRMDAGPGALHRRVPILGMAGVPNPRIPTGFAQPIDDDEALTRCALSTGAERRGHRRECAPVARRNPDPVRTSAGWIRPTRPGILGRATSRASAWPASSRDPPTLPIDRVIPGLTHRDQLATEICLMKRLSPPGLRGGMSTSCEVPHGAGSHLATGVASPIASQNPSELDRAVSGAMATPPMTAIAPRNRDEGLAHPGRL
jgi:hypothetical protein